MLRKPWPEEKTYWKHQLKGTCQDLFFIAKMEQIPEFTKVVGPTENPRALHHKVAFCFEEAVSPVALCNSGKGVSRALPSSGQRK